MTSVSDHPIASAIRQSVLLAALCLASFGPRIAAAAEQAVNPSLVARSYGGANSGQPTHPLTIGTLDITVDVFGGVAHTRVLASFQNPTGTPLEGDFTLDLPAQAVVTGYALDVNGNLVDGVLVGHRKAQLAYQKQVRRGVDPGLAEVTRENAFRTHVFPIMPGRGRTIRLDFAAPVEPDGSFALPFRTLDPVGRVAILVKAHGAAPGWSLSGLDDVTLQWAPTADGLEAHANASNIAVSGAIRLGTRPASDSVSLSRHRAGDTFVAIDAAAPANTNKDDHPAHVRIYWDRSLSRRADDTGSEIDLVQRYVAATHPGTIDLVLFADDQPKVTSFDGEHAGEQLVAALKAVEYHGATSFDGVFKAAPGSADTCLFVSDGRATIDAYRLERTACPLFTLSNAPDADHGFLAALAAHSGGQEIDLHARSIDAGLAQLMRRTQQVVRVAASDGSDLDFTTLPAGPGRVRIVARAPNDQAVTVALSGGKSLAFDLHDLPVVAFDGAGALWARDRLAELDASDRPDPERSLGFARQYGIAGGDATFVVLETLQDYIANEIPPPDSADKMIQAQYAAEVTARAEAKKRAEDGRLDHVVEEWQEEKGWWAAKRMAARTIETLHAEAEAVPPPPPPPPPPPAPEPSPAPPHAVVLDSPLPPPPPPMPAMPAPSADRAVTNASPPPMAVTSLAAPAPFVGGKAASTETNQLEEVQAAPAPRDVPADDKPAPPVADPAITGPAIAIATDAWDPNRPYLPALKSATPERFAAVFKEQEAHFGRLPAFYLDVAEFEFRQGRRDDAAAMALNALELPTADSTTLMIVADRMMRYGQEDRGVWLYDRVLYLEGDRPQPRRSLALALIERAEASEKRGGSIEQQRADYRRAMDLLNQVITRIWDNAFDGIELVALMEANRILPRLEKLGVKDIPLDPRLRALLDVDLRVVLDWYVDATDMDLWVDEPSGERAIYNNPRTRIGGRLSHDMTQGFGPEEYLLHHAPSGAYTVRVNIYRTDRLNPNGPITVRAHLFRGYDRADEAGQVLEIELKPGEDGTRLIGEIKVGGHPAP